MTKQQSNVSLSFPQVQLQYTIRHQVDFNLSVTDEATLSKQRALITSIRRIQVLLGTTVDDVLGAHQNLLADGYGQQQPVSVCSG